MVDPKQDEIEIGDEILLVTVFKEKAQMAMVGQKFRFRLL